MNKKVQQNPDIKNPLLPQVKKEILSDSRGPHNVSSKLTFSNLEILLVNKKFLSYLSDSCSIQEFF